MREWLFCLSLFVTLVGCVPGDNASQAQPQMQPYPPAQPQLEPILANTEWVLDYALIEGIEDDRFGRLVFYDESIYMLDGCAGQWFESAGEGPVYMASEGGEFALAEARNVVADDLEGIVCEAINYETGTTEGITAPWFGAALEQVVAYEVEGEELRLYFPEDRRNVLVFQVPAAQRLIRDIATPDPAGQILDGTRWQLKEAIIEGQVRALMSHEIFRIDFSAESVQFYDGCNYMQYENENGRPSYVAAENGDFALPWGEPVLISTMVACVLEDKESGEWHDIDGPDFMPDFHDIVAYELGSGELRLYYPEDRRSVLVFEEWRAEAQLSEESTQVPEPAILAEPTLAPYVSAPLYP